MSESDLNLDLGLVFYWVHRIERRLPFPVPFDDLVSSGSIGLMKASHRFDRGRGFAFSTYASELIKGEIFELIRQTWKTWHRIVAADKPEPERLSDPNPSPERLVVLRELAEKVEKLPPYWRQIVILHYWGDLNETEIAEIFGVTASRICQIMEAARERMRRLYAGETDFDRGRGKPGRMRPSGSSTR